MAYEVIPAKDIDSMNISNVLPAGEILNRTGHDLVHQPAGFHQSEQYGALSFYHQHLSAEQG